MRWVLLRRSTTLVRTARPKGPEVLLNRRRVGPAGVALRTTRLSLRGRALRLWPRRGRTLALSAAPKALALDGGAADCPARRHRRRRAATVAAHAVAGI